MRDKVLELYIKGENRRLLGDQGEEGATAVEYGMMVALIAAIIVGVVATLGQRVLSAFTTVNDNLPAGP